MRPPLSRSSLLPLVLLSIVPHMAHAWTPPSDSAAVVAVVEEYNEALRRGAHERVSAVLGPSLMMFNGAYSGDPRDWEVHMYLTGEALAAWPGRFVPGSGPHENEVRIVGVNVRGNAALVVTDETGRNKFRQWSGEQVGYLLGREGESWKIVGYFIRDIKNPT